MRSTAFDNAWAGLWSPLITSGQAVSMSGGSLINLSSGGTIPGSSLLRHENNVATAFMNMAQSGTNCKLTDIATAVLTQFPSVNLNFSNLALSGAQQTGINIHPAIPYVQPEMNAGTVLSALGGDITFLQNDFCNVLSSHSCRHFLVNWSFIQPGSLGSFEPSPSRGSLAKRPRSGAESALQH